MGEADPPRETVHSLTVDASGSGRRVDAWLARQFPELSRSVLKSYIQKGRVSVDGETPKPSTTLQAGQQLEVRIPPPPPPFPVPEGLPLDIIYEDEALLVINKTSEMVVHPHPGSGESGTLVNALLNYTDILSSEAGEYRPGIVHRLDRETSGLLLVARTDAAHRHLAAQFKARTLQKEYYALVHGIPRESEGEIDLPLGRSPTHRKKMTIRHDEQGKSSKTRWCRERQLGNFCWLHLFPATGRTHQIRVHLKAIGHPILCDALYGREKKITRSELVGRKPKAGEAPLLERHALHAARLRFQHPLDDRRVELVAPFPPDLAQLWELADSPPR